MNFCQPRATKSDSRIQTGPLPQAEALYRRPIETATYHVHNGIARHESLTEAEVAERLAAVYGKPDPEFSTSLSVVAEELEEAGMEKQAAICRKAATVSLKPKPLGIKLFGREMFAEGAEDQIERLKYRLENLAQLRSSPFERMSFDDMIREAGMEFRPHEVEDTPPFSDLREER